MLKTAVVIGAVTGASALSVSMYTSADCSNEALTTLVLKENYCSEFRQQYGASLLT
jgi:hypothetical protein